MRGGDDFTNINEILDRAVLLDTTQTISSDKTFSVGTTTTYDGDVVLNENTTNEASGVFSNLGNFNNLASLSNEGTFTNLVSGTITNDGTLNIDGTLNLTTDIVADMTTLNITNTGSTNINPQNIMALQVAGTDKMNVSSTTTTLNNTTTNLQSDGTTKYTQNATASTLTNATINLQDATPTTRFTQTNGQTTITNTNIGTNGILTQTGSATLAGTTITLQDATPTTHYLQNATSTTITNNTINLESGGVVDPKLRQTSTLTIIDNDEIRLRYRATNKLVQTSTATTLTNTDIATNGILTQTGNFTAKGTTITLQDATPTTRFLQNNGQTTITNTNIGTNGILTQTGNFTAKGTTITLQDATPTTRFLQNDGATTITNTAIDLTATGSSGAITLTGGGSSLNIGINLDSVGTIRIDSDNDVRVQASDTVRIQAPAGSSRATFTSGTTTLSNTTSISLDHPTTTISSASASKMSITGTTSTFNNTGVVTLQSTGTSGQVSISANNNSTEGILIQQNGIGGVRILSSTTYPLYMGTGTTNYASVSSSGVGATEYWVGSGGANSYPLTYPLMWMSQQTTGQTATQCRIGSFANNDTAETFIRYRLPYRGRIRAMTLISDGETINASQTYIHISVTNQTGLDTTPNYAHWIYDAGVGNTGDIVVTDNGNMTSVADVPANTTFYVYMAFGSTGASINSVGTARSVPSEFQVHLWIQQVI